MAKKTMDAFESLYLWCNYSVWDVSAVLSDESPLRLQDHPVRFPFASKLTLVKTNRNRLLLCWAANSNWPITLHPAVDLFELLFYHKFLWIRGSGLSSSLLFRVPGTQLLAQQVGAQWNYWMKKKCFVWTSNLQCFSFTEWKDAEHIF